METLAKAPDFALASGSHMGFRKGFWAVVLMPSLQYCAGPALTLLASTTSLWCIIRFHTVGSPYTKAMLEDAISDVGPNCHNK